MRNEVKMNWITAHTCGIRTHRLIETQDEGAPAVRHGLRVPHELAESFGGVDASLHHEHDAGPLALPLVASLGDLLVRVAHHGDQHVDQQDGHNRHEHHEQNLQQWHRHAR